MTDHIMTSHLFSMCPMPMCFDIQQRYHIWMTVTRQFCMRLLVCMSWINKQCSLFICMVVGAGSMAMPPCHGSCPIISVLKWQGCCIYLFSNCIENRSIPHKQQMELVFYLLLVLTSAGKKKKGKKTCSMEIYFQLHTGQLNLL